jgi:hypothetical protein
MLKSNYEFEVKVNGSTAKEYYHNGSHYIEGREGQCFSLRMKNNSGSRVLFVPTVDGLSIMSGQEASFKSRGYIVNAYDSLTIDGWRTSDNKVAEFFFSSPKGSYAKKIGKGGNLGVIGCAVFKEKQPQIVERIVYIEKQPWSNPHHDPYNLGSGTAGGNVIGLSGVTPGLYNVQCLGGGGSSIKTTNYSASNLGTGFGQEKVSPTVTVSFEKEESPTETFHLYYNTRRALEDLGVEFYKPVYVAPSAFPNEEGYCQRPD